jgi:hypothetical protein
MNRLRPLAVEERLVENASRWNRSHDAGRHMKVAKWPIRRQICRVAVRNSRA